MCNLELYPAVQFPLVADVAYIGVKDRVTLMVVPGKKHIGFAEH